jgi:CheY-like chemotaxis protein
VILTQYGAEVVTAKSAEEALENLSLNLPHVLVSDIGMPGSDGYELIRQVRNYSPARRLQAVALTAYARKEDRERAFSEGFNDYLSKPVEASELIKIVARLNRRG